MGTSKTHAPAPPALRSCLASNRGRALTRGSANCLPGLRIRTLRAGAVTVVTVNWNSWSHLDVLIDVVRRHSPPDTEILVVDNGSVDGSRAFLAASPDVTTIMLPANVGHDLALDIGVLLCQ